MNLRSGAAAAATGASATASNQIEVSLGRSVRQPAQRYKNVAQLPRMKEKSARK